jgi:hypothetical protein
MGVEMNFFNDLFEKHPNIAILNIDNGCDDIKNELVKIVDELDGYLTYKEFKTIDQKKFKLKAREFEYVVVCDCLHETQNIEKFIDEIYHSLENSAEIIVIFKKENFDPYRVIDILDTANFRAMNIIDIFEHYHLVMAKKMHMWGNGL